MCIATNGVCFIYAILRYYTAQSYQHFVRFITKRSILQYIFIVSFSRFFLLFENAMNPFSHTSRLLPSRQCMYLKSTSHIFVCCFVFVVALIFYFFVAFYEVGSGGVIVNRCKRNHA